MHDVRRLQIVQRTQYVVKNDFDVTHVEWGRFHLVENLLEIIVDPCNYQEDTRYQYLLFLGLLHLLESRDSACLLTVTRTFWIQKCRPRTQSTLARTPTLRRHNHINQLDRKNVVGHSSELAEDGNFSIDSLAALDAFKRILDILYSHRLPIRHARTPLPGIRLDHLAKRSLALDTLDAVALQDIVPFCGQRTWKLRVAAAAADIFLLQRNWVHFLNID